MINLGALTMTLSGGLSGAGQLKVLGSGGILALDGSNSGFSGSMLIDNTSGAGNNILRINNASALGGATGITVQNTNGVGGAVSGTELDFNGNFSLPAIPINLNANTSGLRAALSFEPTAANTYSGAIILSGPGAAQMYENGTAGNYTFTGGITGAATQGLTLRGGGAGSGIIASVINIGSTTLNQTDGGNWTISSTGNTWGATNILYGTLTMGASNVLPAGTTVTFGQAGAAPATLNLNGNSQTIAALSSVTTDTSAMTVTSATAGTLTVATTGSTTYGGILTGAGLTLTQSGTGSLYLSGTTASTYGGGTFINAGTLKLGNTSSLGAAANNTYVANGATLDLNGNSIAAMTGTVFISGTGSNGSGAALINSGAGLTTPNGVGAVTLTGNASVGENTNRLDIMGTLNAQGYTLTKVGNNYMAMKGATTNLSNLIINAGSWEVSGLTGLGINAAATTDTVNAGGTLAFYVGSNMSFANTINLNGGQITGTDNSTATLSGSVNLSSGTTSYISGASTAINVSGLISGAGSMNVNGGSVLFTNPAGNAYTGTTIVSAGTLTVTNASGSAVGSGNVTINAANLASGTLGIISGQVAAGTGAVGIYPGGNGTIGQLNVGSLITSGSTALNFDITSGSNDLINVTGGALTFAAGTVLNVNSPITPGNVPPGIYRLFQYAGGTAVSGSTNVTVSANPSLLPRQAALLSFVPDGSGNYLDLIVQPAGASITSGWNVNAGGSWKNSANWVGGIIPGTQGDTANLGTVLTTTGAITLDSQPQIGTLNLNPSGTGSYTLSSGSAGSVLTMNNTGSTAYINNQANLNTISAPITLFSPTTNVTVSGGTLLVSGAVGGTGALAVQSGSGPLVLTSNETYTGPTTIASGGTLQLGNASTAPTLATSSLTNSGVLSFNIGTTQPTFATAITGSGSVVVIGNNSATPPQLILSSGSNNYSGGTTITGARLEATAVGQVGTGPITVNSSGQFWLDTAITINNNITLNGVGVGEAAPGPYGALRLEAGTFAGNITLGSAATITSNGGTGVISGVISGPITAALQVGSNGGSGTTIFANTANSYQGGTTLGATGTVTLIGAGPGAFGSGSVTVPTGATLGLDADGNGSGAPNVAGTYANTIVLSGTSATLSVNRGGFGMPFGSLLWTQAANQTVNNGSNFSLNNFVLTVTPSNGYGLNLTGALSLAGSTDTFSVATATASNVTQGLTLSGVVSGTGLTKTGAGTLVLTNPGNNFGGSSGTINIAAGMLSVGSDAMLGNSGNLIELNTNSQTQGFRATASFSDSRTFAMAQAANDIEVTAGNTLTLTSPFTMSAAQRTP